MRPDREKPGTLARSLEIAGSPYDLRPAPGPAAGPAAWLVTSPLGATYRVARQAWGWSCSCPAFGFLKRADREAGCKHIQALRSHLARPPAAAPTPETSTWTPPARKPRPRPATPPTG